MHFDDKTGAVTGFTGRVTFEEPNADQRQRGDLSIAELFKLANTSLAAQKKTLWLLLDRLDIAFDDSQELEQNGLRALFRAYRTIRSYDRIALKIFLRSDIWEKISETGFREATHLSRDLTITWDTAALKNLVVRRLLNNPAVCKHYGVARTKVLQDVDAQSKLFD